MILVDAHVHVHHCFQLPDFFDLAFSNFRAEAIRCGQGNSFVGILLLTERANEDFFHRLAADAGDERGCGNQVIGNWTIHRTNERCSLSARSGDGQGLILIAGRQIVTAEDLEVLALATDRDFKDGIPLREVVHAVMTAGAIPVLAWGAGKWLGKRGLIIKDVILNATNESRLFIGDNGGRSRFLPRPSHFRLAEDRGIPILRGTDLLPFKSEIRRAGSFGFSILGDINAEHPAKDLRRLLLDPIIRFQPFGPLEKPHRFVINQLAAQMIKQSYRFRKR
jgi:hypothetical protein